MASPALSSFIRATTPDSSVLGLEESDKQLLPQFVQTAHDNVCHFSFFDLPYSRIHQNVLALMSVGGWGGSQYFSSSVATDANRTAFAKAVLDVVSQYNLDGVEFE
jgi:chitinase